MKDLFAQAVHISSTVRPITSRSLRKLLRNLCEGIDFDRDLAEKILEVSVLERETHEWYLHQLGLVADIRDEDLKSVDHEIAEEVIQNRFRRLTDVQFRCLATNPLAVIQIGDQVHETVSEAWTPIKSALGGALREESQEECDHEDVTLRSSNSPGRVGNIEQDIVATNNTTDSLAKVSLDETHKRDDISNSSWRRFLPTLAASLLAAFSISWSIWLSSQNASLKDTNASLMARVERQAEISRKATSLTKEAFGRTVADSSPLYLSGSTTPTLVRQALLAAMVSYRSGALTEDDKVNLKRGRSLFEEAISLQEPDGRLGKSVFEEVTAAIWSGDLDRAAELLQSSALIPDDPAVINLKGVLAMYEGEYQEDAMPDYQKKAESLFREAAEKGELIAWINLASLMQQQGRTEEAVSALNMYIENASADEADVVREFLPDTTKLPE